MKRLTRALAALATLTLTCVLSGAEFTNAARAGETPMPEARGPATDGPLPFVFVPNAGQADPRVRYSARAAGAAFYFTDGGAVFAFNKGGKGHAVQLTFPGADPSAGPAGARPGDGTVNYLVGDASRWRGGLPTYGEVVYRDLWPGIDLAFRGERGALKYEFRVAPGADPDDIRLAYRGVRRLSIGEGGDLRIHTPLGVIHDGRPVSYQEVGGERSTVASRYTLAGKTYGFETGDYDRGRPLVIDPGLDYSTYLGGSGSERGWDVAVDADGSAYVTGDLFQSPDFPSTAGAFDATLTGDYEAFVTKLDPSGNVVYSTFLGGSGVGVEGARSIAVDSSGCAYVFGATGSSDFPVTAGAFDTTLNGSSDLFVAKLNPSGSGLVYSTFLGGGLPAPFFDAAFGSAIVVDALGSAYVTGVADWNDFPVTPGAFDTTGDSSSGFVAKLNPAGSALVYSTFLGGNGSHNLPLALAVDGSGSAHVTGTTSSSDFPTTPGAFNATRKGPHDAFVTKLSPSGGALEYSTLLGGEFDDQGNAIAVDASGSAYVTGSTMSRDFPTTPCALDRTRGGSSDAFVTKLNPTGTALEYSTYLGGSQNIPGPSGSVTITAEIGYGIAVDASGSAVVTGAVSSPDFPVTPDAFDGTVNADDVFVTRLSATGGFITYSTFLGGSDNEQGLALALDGAGAVYVTGSTSSPDFPVTPGAFDVTYNPGTLPFKTTDVFVTKMTLPPVPSELAAIPTTLRLTPPSAQTPAGTSVTLTAAVGNTLGEPLPNVVVRFGVTGSRFASGSCVTGADGRCGFGYQGPAFNGTDTISAFVDADNDGVRDTCELSATATNIWTGNLPPAVTNPGTQTNDEGDAVSLAVAASDPDGNALTFTANGLPAGLSIDPSTGVISGTVDFNAGGMYDEDGNLVPVRAYSVTVNVSDGLGSTSVTFGWAVTNVEQAPILATVGDRVVTEGTPLSFALSASDPDGGQLTFSADGLPDGATLDPTTGAFSWTPTYEQAGVYAVTFSVTDPTNRSADETITITVGDVLSNLGPVCSGAYPSLAEIWPPDHRRTEVISIYGVTDPDGDPLTITVRQILQDEPTNTNGDGNTWVDGGGLGTPQAWVRAERSGARGNGRVYEIFFEASDGRGKSCTGSVKVGVPHDEGRGPAVDDGRRYDSTVAGATCLNCKR